MKKSKGIVIENLIEVIERADKSISLHLSSKNPDYNSIKNYQEIKAEAITELLQLLPILEIKDEVLKFYHTSSSQMNILQKQPA
jgi:hypothetical protein